MKKFLSLALALGLVGLFAGCSNDAASGDTAKDTDTTKTETATTSTGDIKMGRVNYAAHGDKSFAVAVVAMEGDKIVGASLDEFQFMDKTADGVTPVPNADGAFAEGFKDANKPLASKLDSSKYYSSHMAEAAGSTKTVEENYGAIEDYVIGKTVAELEETLKANEGEKMLDVVSGATLVDTHGYVSALVEAAKSVK
ncbi:hypothetical protein R4Z09_02820 [Niallia oryzisoli]|uniref:Uncharacterized protein n=1 Tax=Niallia oryzisoli TaxID=1737571 RepID=A0ABZ2CF52_9BACI